MKILNQYFPGRVLVLLFTENVLILLGVWVAACVHIGQFNVALLYHPGLFARALLITLVCQVCFYFNDLYDLKSLSSPLEILLRLLKTFGMASCMHPGTGFSSSAPGHMPRPWPGRWMGRR